MRFKVQRGLIEVKAKAGPMDPVTKFPKVTGTIDIDPDEPTAGGRVELTLDMASYDAGERFKNWKLETDLQADKYPTATFKLARLEQFSESTPGKFTGVANGQIRWRGQSVDVKFRGQAVVTRRELEIRGGFDLDLTKLGVPPILFNVFREGDVIRVEVFLLCRS